MNAPYQSTRQAASQNRQAAPQPPLNSAVVDWAQQNIAGMFADAGEAAERLKLAATKCHLIGGASVCPVKIGHEIAITVVPIDPATLYQLKQTVKEGEPPPPPKWGIGRSTLDDLASAADVEWLKYTRLDSGKDMDYAHYEVEGRYLTIAGTYRPLRDQADMDFRQNSRKSATLTDGELKYKRANIVRLTITGARLRAIRGGFGIPHGMVESQIIKPYVFARMIYTGRDANPEIQKLFAHVEAQKQLMAASALYGVPGSVPQLGGGAVGHLTVGARATDVQHIDVDPDDFDPPSDRAPEPGATASADPPPIPANAAPASPAASGPVRPQAAPNEWMPGKEKIKVKDAGDKDLQYWSAKIQKDFDAGTMDSRYVDGNRKKLAAILHEMNLRRRGGEVTPPGGMSPDDIRRAQAVDRGEESAPADADDGEY